MILKQIIAQLHIGKECKRLGVPLWQCPHFLFVVMGVIIIVAILSAYAVGSQLIADPFIVNLVILTLTTFLMVLAYFITRSFERLAEANRLKSEFVNIVSHQLRAPLTNFKWTLDVIRSEVQGVNKKEKEYLQILNTNAARMHELVNELLIVSRIQEGRLPLYKKEFSFPGLLEEIVKEFEQFLRATNINLYVERPNSGVEMIESDPSRIRNVITNLLDNAIKYTKKAIDRETKKQGEIIIRYKKQGPMLYFEIEDNGIGIPKEDQKFLFQRFFRSSNVLKHETRGTGLGLYIAKSIVEKSGGKMGFRSKEGQGSTFWFTVPIE